MTGVNIIRNGRIAAPADAVFSLDDTDVAYGYGCYETLKLRAGVLYFPEFHEERLLRSASILGIRHGILPGEVVAALRLLAGENAIGECNIKIMLIGHDDRPADWYAFMLPPIVPPASAYAEGVRCLMFRGERHFPQAKSLSMLLSTVAYRTASARGCYDALLVNGRGEITEGTRTNLFYVRRGDSGVVYTPPAADVLEGITRRTLIEALANAGTRMVERALGLAEVLEGACGLMVTSTSSRVIPVRAIVGAAGASAAPVPLVVPGGEREGAALDLGVAPETGRVRTIYDAYLERYAKGL